jgi:hypothetical protein
MECFQKASLHREAGVANAYYLRDQAQTTPSGQVNNLRHKRAFLIAAEAFVDCASSAALDSEKPFYYRSAAQCFEHSGKYHEAGRYYIIAEEFDTAAQLFCDKGIFDQATQVLKEYADKINKKVDKGIRTACGLHYFSRQDISYVFQLQPASNYFRLLRIDSQGRDLFSSDDDALEFMKQYKLDQPRIAFLIKLGKRSEAADLCRSIGRKLEAIEILLQSTEDNFLMRRGFQYILSGLWENLCICITREKRKTARQAAIGLLDLMPQVKYTLLDSNDLEEARRKTFFLLLTFPNKTFRSRCFKPLFPETNPSFKNSAAS